MKVAIQQPHYFPWIGYFDKMAKVDQFIIMDEVQLEKRSAMLRNRVLDSQGEIRLLTIQGSLHGYQHMQYRQLKTTGTEEWTKKHLNMLQNYYRKAPYFEEVFQILQQFMASNYETICEWTCASIRLVCDLLEIKTPQIYQSTMEYDRGAKKSDLILSLCLASGASSYLAGGGASKNYLDSEKFAKKNVLIDFQNFIHPIYPQYSSHEFVAGISCLDFLFNCGIEESRRLFWENVQSTHEFDGIEA